MTSLYDSQLSLHSQLDEKDAPQHHTNTAMTPSGLALGSPIVGSGGGAEEDIDGHDGATAAELDMDGKEEQRGLLEPGEDARAEETTSREKSALAVVQPQISTGPKVNLRILVMSGQTHVFTFEPEHTIGRVKEIIWHSWPKEWIKEPLRPPGPAYCRLLYLGRVLADDATLTSLNLRLAPAVTILHLSVRTFEIETEEPPKKSLLPFSFRPTPMTRSNSSQNATQLIPLSVTNAANGIVPIQHGSGSNGDGPSDRPSLGTRISSGRGRARAGAAGASGPNASTTSTSTPVPAGRGSGARSTGPQASATSRSAATYDAGNDSHGGGCKCVIM